MLLLSAALAFELEVHSGLLEERDILREGLVTQEVVKGTPDGGVLTLVVRVPEEWLAPPVDQTAGEAHSVSQVQETVRAMARLPRQSPYLEAARLAAMFRNGSFEEGRPRERYSGVLQLWEVVWEHQTADTLSASVATLEVMEALDLAGSLARYPCTASDTGRAFGVFVDHESEAGVGWSFPAGEGALLTLHPNARPDHDEVVLADLEVWPLSQVLAPGWDPARAGEPAPPPRQKQRAPPSDAQLQDWNYYALSAGTGVGAVLLVGLFGWRTHASRARAAAARAKRQREQF